MEVRTMEGEANQQAQEPQEEAFLLPSPSFSKSPFSLD